MVFAAATHYAIRLEKYKKKYDIQTYREIVAFTEGKKLDEIEKIRESGKRPYQHALSVVIAGVLTFAITIFIEWLIRSFIL